MGKSIIFLNTPLGGAHVFLARFILEHKRLLLIGGLGVLSAAMVVGHVVRTRAPAYPIVQARGSPAGNVRMLRTAASLDPEVCDFALGETRKALGSNQAVRVLQLTLDPDYRGAGETVLVNAIIDAGGSRQDVGVVVKVNRTPQGMKATLAYVD